MKNGEGLGAFRHVSGCEVEIGAEGAIFKYVRTKLESEFVTGQDISFAYAKVWSPKLRPGSEARGRI